MPDTIDRVRQLIGARLRELDAEVKQLEHGLRTLGGRDGVAVPRRPAARKPPRRKAATRVPRGERRRQFLTALEKNPGANASEIAKQIGVSSNQSYTLARRLQQEGAIKKSGKGYRLAVSTSSK